MAISRIIYVRVFVSIIAVAKALALVNSSSWLVVKTLLSSSYAVGKVLGLRVSYLCSFHWKIIVILMQISHEQYAFRMNALLSQIAIWLVFPKISLPSSFFRHRTFLIPDHVELILSEIGAKVWGLAQNSIQSVEETKTKSSSTREELKNLFYPFYTSSQLPINCARNCCCCLIAMRLICSLTRHLLGDSRN